MTDEPLIRWDWVARNAPDLIVRAGEHIVMTLIAVVTGFVLSFVLALPCTNGGIDQRGGR